LIRNTIFDFQRPTRFVMKKLIYSLILIPVLLALSLIPMRSSAQGCSNTFLSGLVDASNLGGNEEVINNCNFYGDYSRINNVSAGSNLKFAITNGGFITIREGAVNGPVLATGMNETTVTSLSGQDLFVHWNSNSACGTEVGACIETTVQCLNCSGCIAANFSTSLDITDPDPIEMTISNCNLSNQYNEITGVPALRWLLINSTSGYLVLREGAPNGPIIDQGFQQVDVIASGANLYLHYFDDASCSTNNNSNCISSNIRCISCPWQDPEDGECFNDFGAATVDISNTSNNVTTISICQFQTDHAEVTGVPSGQNIVFDYEVSTYITVREGLPNGPVVAQGFSPVTVVSASGSNLYPHYTVNENCDTQFFCWESTVECSTCTDCPLGNVGDLCEDGNSQTTGTTIQADCSCGGGSAIPQNDSCTDISELLTCNEEVIGNTDFASFSGIIPTNCSGLLTTTGDTWYAFQADGSSNYELQLFQEPGALAWEGSLHIYDGNCNSLTEVACSNNSGTSSESISLTVPSAGIYYVQVFAQSEGNDAYRLRLLCSPSCSNPFPAVNPSSLSTSVTPSNIQLTWDAVPGQIGCQLQLQTAQGTLVGSQIVGGVAANDFVIPSGVLSPGVNYQWRVRCGCSQSPPVVGPFSSWQNFIVPSGIQIETNPNPTSGISNVTFSLYQAGYTTLVVYDMNGRLVEAIFAGNTQADKDYRFEFDGSDLPNGIYLYRVTSALGVKNEKFVIAR